MASERDLERARGWLYEDPTSGTDWNVKAIESLAAEFRAVRLEEVRRMEVVLEGEAALELISGDGIIGILRRKVRQRITDLEAK